MGCTSFLRKTKLQEKRNIFTKIVEKIPKNDNQITNFVFFTCNFVIYIVY